MPDPIRVLLVDDQRLFREALVVMINAQSDLTVVGQAGDGALGLSLVRQTNPDIILLDMRMVPMDGVEFTQRLFKTGPFQEKSATAASSAEAFPRVIVLTTFNLDDKAAQAIRNGASGFLLKETSPEFLIEAIRTVHAGNAVLAPQDLLALPSLTQVMQRQQPADFTRLSDIDKEIFRLVAQGMSNAEIAATLFLSESTIKTHVGTILRTLEMRDRVQIVVYAYKNGLADDSK